MATYVRQLNDKISKRIVLNLRKKLLKEGYSEKEIKHHIQNALDSKISDLPRDVVRL